MNDSLRIVFAGTPEFAAHHLQALLDSSHKVVAVYTQPDRPAGRGKKLRPSAVKQLAQKHSIAVEQPVSLKSSEQQAVLARYQADVMVVVAYGLILPQAILDTPQHGCINVHGSLLPRWRGAAPIQRAIWAGDQQSGVAVMQMEAGLDTGPVLLEETCQITADETSPSLYHKLEQLGPKALIKALDSLSTLQSSAKPQIDGDATYATKLSKEEGQLDWQQDALQLARNVRAFVPWPTAWFELDGFKGGQSTVKVLQAEAIDGDAQAAPGTIVAANDQGIDIACGNGMLRVKQAQVPGKKPQPCSVILQGYPHLFELGKRLN